MDALCSHLRGQDMGELNWKRVFSEIVLNLMYLQLLFCGCTQILIWILIFFRSFIVTSSFCLEKMLQIPLQYIPSYCQPLFLFSQSILTSSRLELNLLFWHVKRCLITLEVCHIFPLLSIGWCAESPPANPCTGLGGSAAGGLETTTNLWLQRVLHLCIIGHKGLMSPPVLL